MTFYNHILFTYSKIVMKILSVLSNFFTKLGDADYINIIYFNAHLFLQVL